MYQPWEWRPSQQQTPPETMGATPLLVHEVLGKVDPLQLQLRGLDAQTWRAWWRQSVRCTTNHSQTHLLRVGYIGYWDYGLQWISAMPCICNHQSCLPRRSTSMEVFKKVQQALRENKQQKLRKQMRWNTYAWHCIMLRCHKYISLHWNISIAFHTYTTCIHAKV